MKDVKVTIVSNKGCPYSAVGQWFVFKSARVYHPGRQGICLYSLSAMAPNLTLLQTDPGSTDHVAAEMTEFHCPHNYVTYRAERIDDFDVTTL
jgi:uncharacterized repeat protein (TIGR04076 family)